MVSEVDLRLFGSNLAHSTQADAQACLKLHGTQLNGRFLKLEISDPNHANKKSSHT